MENCEKHGPENRSPHSRRPSNAVENHPPVRIAVLEAEARKDAEHIASLQKTIFTSGEVTRPSLPAPTPETTRPGILDGIRAWLKRRLEPIIHVLSMSDTPNKDHVSIVV